LRPLIQRFDEILNQKTLLVKAFSSS